MPLHVFWQPWKSTFFSLMLYDFMSDRPISHCSLSYLKGEGWHFSFRVLDWCTICTTAHPPIPSFFLFIFLFFLVKVARRSQYSFSNQVMIPVDSLRPHRCCDTNKKWCQDMILYTTWKTRGLVKRRLLFYGLCDWFDCFVNLDKDRPVDSLCYRHAIVALNTKWEYAYSRLQKRDHSDDLRLSL